MNIGEGLGLTEVNMLTISTCLAWSACFDFNPNSPLHPITNLKEIISKTYNIPIDKIALAKAGLAGSYPPLLNAANVQHSCYWINDSCKQLSDSPLSVYNDSATIIVRDTRENFKELSGVERAELQRSEAIRIGNVKKTYESQNRYMRVERDIVIRDESQIQS